MIFMSQSIIFKDFSIIKKCKNHSLQVSYTKIGDSNIWPLAYCLLTPALTCNFENKAYNVFANTSNSLINMNSSHLI